MHWTFGLSHYLLDTYAIKKFVHVPSSDNISFNELSQYTLIAL